MTIGFELPEGQNELHEMYQDLEAMEIFPLYTGENTPLAGRITFYGSDVKTGVPGYGKKQYQPLPSINLNSKDIFVGANEMSKRLTLTGFVDKEGFFVGDVNPDETVDVVSRFEDEYIKDAIEEINAKVEKITELKREIFIKQNENNEDTAQVFTGVKKFDNFLSHGIRLGTFNFIDGGGLRAGLLKQFSNVSPRKLPRDINSRVVFKNESPREKDLSGTYVTDKLHYSPVEDLTAEDIAKVEKFFSVFFDDYNKELFTALIGATLLNVKLSFRYISKLAVISGRPGSGKSSLLRAITHGLFDDKFATVLKSFDTPFDVSSRHATVSLADRRLTVYMEAEWGIRHGEMRPHDFTGLDVDAIKSMVTDGIIEKEAKYQSRESLTMSSIQIVATNHPPHIPEDDFALARRLVGIVLQPTSMEEKARELGLESEVEFNNFVFENADIFAKYCIQMFENNQTIIKDAGVYDREEFVRSIQYAEDDIVDREQSRATAINRAKTFPALLDILEQFAAEDKNNDRLSAVRQVRTNYFQTADSDRDNEAFATRIPGGIVINAAKGVLKKMGDKDHYIYNATASSFGGMEQRKIDGKNVRRVFVPTL